MVCKGFHKGFLPNRYHATTKGNKGDINSKANPIHNHSHPVKSVIGSIPPPAPDLSQPPPTIQPATIVSFHNHNHKQNAVVTTTASTKAATLPKGQGQKGQVGTKAVGFEMTPATVNGLPPGTAAADVATPTAVGNPNQPVTSGNVTKGEFTNVALLVFWASF